MDSDPEKTITWTTWRRGTKMGQRSTGANQDKSVKNQTNEEKKPNVKE